MPLKRNTVSLWRSAGLANTLFLHANYRDHRFQPHFHDEYAIGIIEQGCQAFSYDAKPRIDLSEGTVCFISPGMVHEGWVGAEDGWTYRMFYPAVDLVEQAANDIFGTNEIAFGSPAVHDPELHRNLQRLHLMSASPFVERLELETTYLSTIRMSVQRHAGGRLKTDIGRHSSGLQQIRDFLEDQYSDGITLNELKDLSGLSKFHLLRQFKSVFGLAPHAYLTQVRIRRATIFIRSGNNLADTAAAVGFVDQAHMTHAFRRTLGYTPGLLRKAVLKD